MSGNDICHSRFHIFALICCAWSALVRWCPSLSAAIVTQLVTRLGARPDSGDVSASYLPRIVTAFDASFERESAAPQPRWGKEAVSYQPPPDDRDDAAGRQPPGWYLDPISQQALRWWDGVQWGQQTQPLPGRGQEPQTVYPQLRGLAISLLRLDGQTNIAAANRHHARDPQRTLQLLQTV